VMVIQKFEYLKSFENDLKQQLSVDKLYLPISKKLVVLLRQINPFLESIQKNQQELKTNFLQKNLNINKAYAASVENFHRSLKIIEEKNHDEVEKSQKLKLQKSHEINHNLKFEFEKIEQKINQANLLAEENTKNAEMNYKRELSGIQKIMASARKKYQQNTLAIETEKTDATSAIGIAYDKKIKGYEDQIIEFDEKYKQNFELLVEESKQISDENDETYLVIKNTYTQLSIQLNKKINEIKKKQQQSVIVIDKEYQTKLKPITKAIEKLKVEYQEAQNKSLAKYTEKLTSLNVIFDVQKESYEAKKNRIIHESNEAITLLNSKLSAYRETTQKEKLQISRKMRDEMKSLETVVEKDKQTRILTRTLNAFDSDLNKQIIRTNKDILEKQRDQQRRLFAHDQKHLKEINEWRLKKVVYEYEKKQDFAKIDLNFHHNLASSEQQLKLLQTHYNYQKEILLLNMNKDLLPLEFQLAIAAAVQERELNLLGNDAHMSIASYKYKETILELELNKNKALIELERELSKTLYSADSQVLNVSIQLELEKEKIKRDFILKEQELRIELNQALLNKSTKWKEHELSLELDQIESDKELMLIESKYQLDVIKSEALKEERKREYVISEARYKNQQRMSNEKASRFLKIYRAELEYNQQQTEYFVNITMMYYKILTQLKTQLAMLYHLPSHPEIFKGTMNILSELTKELKLSLIFIIEHFQELDQEFYIKKIEDLTGYKYMLKHEDTMNFYDQEINKILQKRAYTENDIKKLEEQFFVKQSELDRKQMIMSQLSKNVHDSKENHKEYSNHEKDIKLIRKDLLSVEKKMDALHLSLLPIDKESEKLKEKQSDVESSLEHAKHQEAALFYRFLNQNQTIYQMSTEEINQFFDSIQLFYQALLNEVYVADSFLTQELKLLDKIFLTFEKQFIVMHQKLLNQMLSFYHQNEKEQLKMIKGFKKSMSALIRSLKQTYTHQVNECSIEQTKRMIEKEKQIKSQKHKIKKKLELSKQIYQKRLMNDQLMLKQIETRITDNNSKQLQELQLLNDNQLSIAAQYNSEYEQKKKSLKDIHFKNIAQMDTGIQTQEKNNQTLEESISAKNQVILSRYQVIHEKNIESLKQKTFHYEQVIQKADQTDSDRNHQAQITVKRLNKKREEELKNILSHHKRYLVSTRRSQNRVLGKELRILKKSHGFKMRMLHLN